MATGRPKGRPVAIIYDYFRPVVFFYFRNDGDADWHNNAHMIGFLQ